MSERLRKLIPLLSSDKDGEVVAAARAIGRELRAANRDWHWLAALASGQAPTAPNRPRVDTPAPPGYDGDAALELIEMIEHLVAAMSRLRPKEREFVMQQMYRVRQYGAKTVFSAKQAKWLRDLHRRYLASDYF